MEKTKNNAYNHCMQKNNYQINIDHEYRSGQQWTDLIEDVHDDYLHFLKTRESHELIIYYRDLLSYLVKNYGH